MTQILGIIPARYASTRFPGKPLALLHNKPMIRWVYESVQPVFSHLVVATDDDRIYKTVMDFGGRAVMTSPDHQSGTERCAEAYSLYQDQSGEKFSHVVNIQGDEPLIKTEQLTTLLDCVQVPGTGIATLIQSLQDQDELVNPNVVKVVVDKSFKALYFSRSPIPHMRDFPPGQWSEKHTYYSHIGLYAFRSDVLEEGG